ncbi:hypothetical protein A9Q87_10435 [Flavobacteriales bacterium 34_180_T64]|nr:hypothetical protein A9Q87_10435 [Flavobacteriales bacterium 34_180_T64]
MKSIIIFVLALFVTSCAPIYVNYDYEKTADFTQYKTYNYYKDLETGLSELDTKRLLNSLDMSLQAKGFSKSETPDMFINITSSEYIESQRSTVGVGVGGTGGNVGGGISVGIPLGQSNVNRQITIDFIDENGIGLIWQAISETTYNPDASPEKRQEKFKAIVDKVLSQYPPK